MKNRASRALRQSVEDDRLLTAVEVAQFLNLKNVGTVYHMVSAKRIPVIPLSSRCIRFSRQALAEWIESKTQKAE